MPGNRSTVEPVDDWVIVKSIRLPMLVDEAFAWLTDPARLESWLCSRARVGHGVGEPFELYWDLADPENDSTIGCRLTAYAPPCLLAFQWRSPKQFKAFANSADPLTHVVVSFHQVEAATLLTLIHSGWRASDEWRRAAAWQDKAWDFAFGALRAQADGT
jgi:uncharacterized protein YndB with AHSA1/START domain